MTWDDEAGPVGIFWVVPDAGGRLLVTEATNPAAAEPYGDFLTHPNDHHETWTAWQTFSLWSLAQRGRPVAIAWYESEDLPRGRVAFHVPNKWFTVYAEKRLLEPSIQAQIIVAFTRPAGRTGLLTDPHDCTATLQGNAL